MPILAEGNLDASLSRLVDSIIPVVSSIFWIVAIRLINRWLPKDNDDDEDDDNDIDEKRPDLPMK